MMGVLAVGVSGRGRSVVGLSLLLAFVLVAVGCIVCLLFVWCGVFLVWFGRVVHCLFGNGAVGLFWWFLNRELSVLHIGTWFLHKLIEPLHREGSWIQTCRSQIHARFQTCRFEVARRIGSESSTIHQDLFSVGFNLPALVGETMWARRSVCRP